MPADYHEPRHRLGFLRWLRRRRDGARDVLAARILAETDLDARIELIRALTPWERLNSEREAVFTSLLELTCGTNWMLDRALVGLVHRYLQRGEQSSVGFEEHPWRYFVLRCSARVLLRPDASGRLVRELRYAGGGGAALKLLLDVAEYAVEHDQLDLAKDALQSVNLTLTSGANWAHFDLMSDVVAYRMLYLNDRILASVLKGMSMVWTAFLKPRVLARLVDDSAYERPELLGTLMAVVASDRCSRVDDYLDYLEFVDSLFSPLARRVALEAYVFVPVGKVSAQDITTVIEALEGYRAEPECEVVATQLLIWLVDHLEARSPALVPDLVARQRSALPDSVAWPAPPPALPKCDFDDRLDELARFMDDLGEARSSKEGDVPEPQDPARRRRLTAAESHADRRRRTVCIEQEGMALMTRWTRIRVRSTWFLESIWYFVREDLPRWMLSKRRGW